MKKVLHVMKQFPCGGGMDAVARLHLERGEMVVSLSQTDSKEFDDCPNYWNLGGGPNQTLKSLRNRLLEKLEVEKTPFEGTLFYNGYGVEWLGESPFFGKKILYLHTDYPTLEDWFKRTLRYVDGFIFVNPALVTKVRKGIPFLPLSRLHTLPYPVNISQKVWDARNHVRDKLILGYSGRIQWRQKRLERLAVLKEALDKSGLDYQFEFLGDGPAKADLVQYFAGDPRWVFHGFAKGDDYWSILSRWKYIVFTSDYEGLPISLLEGVAAGAVPVFPQIIEDDWVFQLNPVLEYPFGEVGEIPRILQIVESWGSEDWKRFHADSSQKIKPHLGQGYVTAYDSYLASLSHHPVRKNHYKPSYPSWLPLWVYHRVQHKLQFGRFRPAKFNPDYANEFSKREF